MNDTSLTVEEKRSISMRLGIDLAGAGIVLMGVLWSVLQPDQQLVGSCIQALAALLVSGTVLFRGIRDLFQANPLQYSDQLVAIAVLAAAASGDFVTATLVPLALDLGRIFEERTALGTRSAIRNIQALQAEKATRIVDGVEESIEVAQLSIGDILLVRAGERIAADGVVISGRSSVDQSAMTGEATPEMVSTESEVYAGTTNLQGVLQIKVSSIGRETAIGRIISLLGTAEESKTPIIRQVEQWLAMYMPVALALAATVLFFTEDLSRAIAVLIVAFPTSLAIAGPATMVAAFSKASRLAFLIKEASFFQLLYQADTVIFDKTGTLTKADQSISKIVPQNGGSEEEVLFAAALCAKASLHPISQMISRAAVDEGLNIPICDAEEFSGRGVALQEADSMYRLGRLSWLAENGVDTSCAEEKGAGSWVSRDQELLGFIGIEDPLREEAKQVIDAFVAAGFIDVVLLTGDQSVEASRVADKLGIEQVFSEKLPEEKLHIVKDIRSQGRQVLMVGDGVNDALALQEANVGIAIGSSLNRAAAGGADAALLSSELQPLLSVLELADTVQKTIIQNIVLAIVFALLLLSLATLGVISPLMAAIVHNLGALLVIGNVSRILVDSENSLDQLHEESSSKAMVDG